MACRLAWRVYFTINHQLLRARPLGLNTGKHQIRRAGILRPVAFMILIAAAFVLTPIFLFFKCDFRASG